MKLLNYVFQTPCEIPLNLYLAEKYQHAVVVQPLVGGLIVYDNYGGFRPLIAKSWTVGKDGVWSFFLHSGIKCENGEEITPSSFKKSLEISLKAISSTIDYPIFRDLKGYSDFMQNETSDLAGIQATDTDLQFHFSRNIRDGLLQTLTIAPFGYICSENRNSDGTWKDDHKFISSGPYKVTHHSPGFSHVLELREDWPLAKNGCVERVNFFFSQDQVVSPTAPTILDFGTRKVTNVPTDFRLYELYREYCPTILMNPKSSFFSNIKNRIALKNEIIKVQDSMPFEMQDLMGARFLFENQPPKEAVFPQTTEINMPPSELILFGPAPAIGSKLEMLLDVLEKALMSLGWTYRFNNAERTPENIAAGNYDLRLAISSYGFGAEAWILEFIFFSEIDIQLPDPSGRVKEAIHKFEQMIFEEQEFSDEFNQAVHDDAAIVPVGHFGINLCLSKEISLNELSPFVRVLRFDQLSLE